jgi:hypothetical protein
MRIKLIAIFTIHMQKIIDQITKRLALLINKEIEFYTYEDLVATKIPDFIIERIRMALEAKVRDELSNFTNSWVDYSNQNVQDAWENFIKQALSASNMPRDHLEESLKYAVQDAINVMIEPRKNMGNYIFREDNMLHLKELEYRCTQLTIYKHFGAAIPMYMKKKRLERISKVKCISLIQKIDTKLVATYKPEDWIQKLEQLFILCDGKVYPKLLSTFFNDKNLPRIAEKFTKYDQPLSKTDIISILSTKEIEETYSDEQIVEELPMDGSISELSSEKIIEDSGPENETNLSLNKNIFEQEIEETSIEIDNDTAREIEQSPEESLNELFIGENDDDPTSENTKESTTHTKMLIQIDSKEVLDDDENSLLKLDQTSEPAIDITDSEAEMEELTHSESDQPMWAQFLSPDHNDLLMDENETSLRDTEFLNEDAEIIVNDTFENEIFEDVGTETNDSIQRVSVLRDLLYDRELEFLEVIFKSKETEFESALITLSTCTNWKEASNFIQNDIFEKNNVDLLSGVTVDFTDRMHRYFHA